MTVKDARGFGGGVTTEAAAILFFMVEITAIIYECQGDFGNGILFFIFGQTNILFLLAIIFLFTTMYLLGSQAGYRIIIKSKNYPWTAFLFALVSTILSIAYFAGYVFLYNQRIDPAYNLENKNEILHSLMRGGLLLFLPMLFAWFWATKRMHEQIVKPDNQNTENIN